MGPHALYAFFSCSAFAPLAREMRPVARPPWVLSLFWFAPCEQNVWESEDGTTCWMAGPELSSRNMVGWVAAKRILSSRPTLAAYGDTHAVPHYGAVEAGLVV